MSNKKILGFAVFYLVSVALVVLYFSVWKDTATTQKAALAQTGNASAEMHLISESDSLLNQLKELQKLDEQYAALFVQSKVTAAMDSVDTKIAEKEYLFNNIIDSFERKKITNPGDRSEDLVNKLTSFFRQTLENRRAIGNTRYALATGNFDFDSSQQRWLKLNSDLIISNNRIQELESRMATNSNIDSSSPRTLQLTGALKSSLNDEQKKNASLLTANASLKQSLKSLNEELSKYTSAKGTVDNNTPVTNTVDDLNTEIQFARVDCNLARADVKQIISNSRQRKELLSDAFKLLNTLSKSNNPGVQNKAKAKIQQLHSISETVRD